MVFESKARNESIIREEIDFQRAERSSSFEMRGRAVRCIGD